MSDRKRTRSRQPTFGSISNFTQDGIESQMNRRLSEGLPNETKLTHTYLSNYVPNEVVPNETGGEREGSL